MARPIATEIEKRLGEPFVLAWLDTAIGESIAVITPKLLDVDNQPLRMSPPEYKVFLARDLATWKKIVETVK